MTNLFLTKNLKATRKIYVFRILDSIQFLSRGGLTTCLFNLTTHFFLSRVTGRGEQEEREERGRGATSADGVRQRKSAH